MCSLNSPIAARLSVVLMAVAMSAAPASAATLTLTDAQLLDRIQGGWLAKCAGGALGGPSEGSGLDTTRGLPALTTGDITNCGNDDVYVQVPFVATMSAKMGGANGIYTATTKDYGDAFNKTTFAVWCGNAVARQALNNGIIAPYSGGWPQNGVTKTGNGCGGRPACEDIDWQIECQWIGIATPGLPATCVRIDSICGHVIAYANGIYAGRFYDVAMSIAPQFTDIHALLKAARVAIPTQCIIRQNIDTLIWFHDNNPTSTYMDAMNWAFGLNGQTKHISGDYNVGSKDNSAIVVIAALWSDNSITKAVLWAARMGEDTDCNCGDVCGILGSMLGYANLPQQWRTTYEQAMASGGGCIFAGTGLSTDWTFKTCLDSTVSIARKAILQSGGTYANGTYTIPVQDIPTPCFFEQAGKSPVSIPCSTPVTLPRAPVSAQRLTVRIATNGSGLRVRFFVPAKAAGVPLSIELLDISGRMVGRLVTGALCAGDHAVGCTPSQEIRRLHGRFVARVMIGGVEQSVTVAPPW